MRTLICNTCYKNKSSLDHTVQDFLEKPWLLIASTVSALAIPQLSVPGLLITAHNGEPLTVCHQTVDNAINPMLAHVGKEFASHGITPLTLGVLFPTVPLNIHVCTVLIILALWIDIIKQDSVHITTLLNIIVDLKTTTNNLTDF